MRRAWCFIGGTHPSTPDQVQSGLEPVVLWSLGFIGSNGVGWIYWVKDAAGFQAYLFSFVGWRTPGGVKRRPCKQVANFCFSIWTRLVSHEGYQVLRCPPGVLGRTGLLG